MSNQDTAPPPAPDSDCRISDSMIWFVSLILRLLPRALCHGRMRYLINNTKLIQRLLLPLVSEQFLPLVVDSARRSESIPHVIGMHFTFPELQGRVPTMRDVMNEARERCLAPIADYHMKEFVDECRKLNGTAAYDFSTICIPYVKDGKLHMVYVSFVGDLVSVLDTYRPIDLNAQSGNITSDTFFFRPSKIDRSNCFVC